MRRAARRGVRRPGRPIRLFFFLSGGLFTAVWLVFFLISLEQRSIGRDASDPPAPPRSDEREEGFSFYDTLKGPAAQGSDPLPLAPPPGKPGTARPSPQKEPVRDAGPPPIGDAPKAKTYTVQVGSFREKPAAEALARRLLRKGYPTTLFSYKVSGSSLWYRVRVGSYRDRDEASRMVQRLSREERLSGFVALEDP
jgi:cell division protein FtsN